MRSSDSLLRTVALATALAGGALAGCGGSSSADARVTPDSRVAEGSLSLTWTVADLAGAPFDCALLGNPDVQVVAVPRTGAQATVVLLPCVAGQGTAPGVPAGTLDVEVRLRGAQGQFGTTVTFNGVEVPDAGELALGAVAFQVARTGGLTFSIDITDASSNCTTEVSGGAAVTGFQLELARMGGACIPGTVFDVGGTPFTSNCDGARVACFEGDVVVALAGLDAGAYEVRLDGYENDQLCYPRVSQVSILGGDVVRALGPVLVDLLDPTPDGAAVPLCGNP